MKSIATKAKLHNQEVFDKNLKAELTSEIQREEKRL